MESWIQGCKEGQEEARTKVPNAAEKSRKDKGRNTPLDPALSRSLATLARVVSEGGSGQKPGLRGSRREAGWQSEK